MTLTSRTSIGIITGLTGLVLNVTNPNFEFKDITKPGQVIEKMKYEENGLFYGVGYAMLAASLVALGYNISTGNFRKKENE